VSRPNESGIGARTLSSLLAPTPSRLASAANVLVGNRLNNSVNSSTLSNNSAFVADKKVGDIVELKLRSVDKTNLLA